MVPDKRLSRYDLKPNEEKSFEPKKKYPRDGLKIHRYVSSREEFYSSSLEVAKSVHMQKI